MSELRALGVEAVQGEWTARSQAALLVLDDAADRAAELATFLRFAAGRRAIANEAAAADVPSEQVHFVGARPTPTVMRGALLAAISGRTVDQEELAS